jgi:hypothetical protein
MRKLMHLMGVASVAAALITCEPAVRVRTTMSPDTNLEGLRTFQIMRVPARHGYRRPSPLDPMIYNSATNRALRAALREGFEDRGYVLDDERPDFGIAYYASAKEKLDVTVWNYGYRWRPRWWGPSVVTVYNQGTVIVDVIDPRTNDLLWRGTGVSVVSDDPREFRQDLGRAVAAIVARFPAARAMVAHRD